jgi:hypothetical protein
MAKIFILLHDEITTRQNTRHENLSLVKDISARGQSVTFQIEFFYPLENTVHLSGEASQRL